eukprot:scaffold113772_cov32-Tisochrysis_lutea.AAC.4
MARMTSACFLALLLIKEAAMVTSSWFLAQLLFKEMPRMTNTCFLALLFIKEAARMKSSCACLPSLRPSLMAVSQYAKSKMFVHGACLTREASS